MPITTHPTIVWFRDDLRAADNPALYKAGLRAAPVICVYIREKVNSLRPLGGAANWWLHHSLKSLSSTLSSHDVRLVLKTGDPLEILSKMAGNIGADHVMWNRRYAPDEIDIDQKIKFALKGQGLHVESFNANLLNEPWEIKTGSDKPYKVFTPYWRACRPQSAPLDNGYEPSFKNQTELNVTSENLADWNLDPENPDWAEGFSEYWNPGETGAREQLEEFLGHGIDGYKDNRDVPAQPATSFLSPYLRFGEISPKQIWRTLDDRFGDNFSVDAEKFLAEIGWREFSKTLLFYADDLSEKNWKDEFDSFPWRDDPQGFKAWTQGQTGYPLVDAGMRQLWQKGWMHNRVRMVTASFLIKHLMINWREGEKWFWDTLVDADAASNPASWQWVAGSGADASPFFRIFNPIIQSEKFDPDGDYIRRFVPELKDVPKKHIHAPWAAPKDVLEQAGVTLGETYPKPIVDHKFARERALSAYKAMRS
ncbi:MAG: deoxyribodipyrimidine photo-lyase [Hyphomonadaceae bacterium]|nr:deoxyribodipyrimidine photo-lyase [Hyphomonadaceae bacterium]